MEINDIGRSNDKEVVFIPWLPNINRKRGDRNPYLLSFGKLMTFSFPLPVMYNHCWINEAAGSEPPGLLIN